VEEETKNLFEAARAIYEAAIGAVLPERLVRSGVVRDGDLVRIAGETFDLGAFEDVYVIAFGKASAGMAGALAGVLGERLAGGLVIAPVKPEEPAGRLEYLEASHPLPDKNSVAAARRALDLASRAGEKDLVFVCISGGGSALLCLPAEGITIDEKKSVTGSLLRAGADIREMNVVRKHLSGIKGGRLAGAAQPATLVNLVISDVIGDDLESIASGPTHWDSSTFSEARGILEKYGLWDGCPASVRGHIERGARGEEAETLKKDEPVFRNVHTFIVGNNLAALRGARREAERLGFETFILTAEDHGEARRAARDYLGFIAGMACSLEAAPKPVCLLAGGELTVTVKGRGKGGRNTEFVLASLVEMEKEGIDRLFCSSCAFPEEGGGESPIGDRRSLDWLILSIGTDGIDGPTDAAGAWGDASVPERARELGADPVKHLEDNDSYSFFNETGNLIITGPTGTNVCDVRIFLIRPS
jgi:glycerate 2-kinase